MKPTKNLKIIVACHRPCHNFQDNTYTFLHAGSKNYQDPRFKVNASHSIDFFKRGTDISEDPSIRKHLLGLSELSRVYYAWKHYKNFGNPDFIGLCHYRRQFIFNETLHLPTNRWLPNSSTFVFNTTASALPYFDSKLADNLLEKYDIVTTKKYNANLLEDGKHYKSCKDRFIELTQLPALYDQMESLLLDFDPTYKEEIQELRDNPEHYLFNMFIMPKDLFFEYCEMIFPILFKLDESNTNAKNFTQKRAPGFLAEFLTSMFISHQKRLKGLRVAELNTTFIKNPDPLPSELNFSDLMDFIKIKFKSDVLRKNKYHDHKIATIELYKDAINSGIKTPFPKIWHRILR